MHRLKCAIIYTKRMLNSLCSIVVQINVLVNEIAGFGALNYFFPLVILSQQITVKCIIRVW